MWWPKLTTRRKAAGPVGPLGIPAPFQPPIHLSLTSRERCRFHLPLNDGTDVEFSFWRSADPKTWERVPSAEIRRDGLTLLFTDPSATAGESFYHLRQVPLPRCWGNPEALVLSYSSL